jgi:SAM-dependent methyltransferase
MTGTPRPIGSSDSAAAGDVMATISLFDQWQVYSAIIEHDWMRHREIHAAIHAFVKANYQTRFSLLDVGCGDAGFIRRTFGDTQLAHYTGVDASAAALEAARRQLAAVRFSVRLVDADLMAYLADASGQEHNAHELILAGYAVHHLASAEKQRFFALCRSVLGPAGSLVFYDFFRRPGESREECVAAYTETIRTSWGLAGDALESTCRHVREHDFPETLAATQEMARKAGFESGGIELFADADGFHRLLCFVT